MHEKKIFKELNSPGVWITFMALSRAAEQPPVLVHKNEFQHRNKKLYPPNISTSCWALQHMGLPESAWPSKSNLLFVLCYGFFIPIPSSSSS